MKIKCKECDRKFKSHKEIDCDKSRCRVKYPFNEEALDYSKFKGGKIDVIADFTSEEPKQPVIQLYDNENMCGFDIWGEGMDLPTKIEEASKKPNDAEYEQYPF